MPAAVTPTDSALALRGLTFTPVGRRSPTLTDVTLSIPAGQRVLLAGASGSGKSTLLRALAGLLADGDTTGEVPPEPADASRRALMVQNPAHAIVAANAGLDIAFAPENEQVPPADMPETVERARALAQFDAPLHTDPFALSGGQQQRLSLAGTLAVTSAVMLMDEPLSMVDEATAREIRASILSAADATGRTLVIADHRLDAWWDEMDRVIVLGPGGRILADDAPERIDLHQPELLCELGLAIEPCSAPPAPASPASPPAASALHDRPAAHSSAPVLDVNGALAESDLLAGTVHVTAHPGDLVVLTGPSGVGKSTLLRRLIDEGPCSFLPQNPEISFCASTVLGEAMATPGVTEEAARAALEQVRIGHLAQANPFTLSGGEQRRLAFAAATASNRPVLLLDEPTVGLDPLARRDVLDMIRAQRDAGVAVIAATHDPGLVAEAEREVPLVPSASRSDMHRRPADGAASAPIPRVRRSPVVPADGMNPLVIIAVALAAAIGSFAVDSLLVGAVAASLTLLVVPLAARTPKRLGLRLLPVSLAALSLAWSTLLLSGRPWGEAATWALAASEALRLFAFVAPGAVLAEAVDPTRLGQALAQHLRMPARAMAAMTAGLVRVGHIRAQWSEILLIRRVRGIHRRNPVALYAGATLTLLVWTLRGAETQAVAMDARGFAEAKDRTWAHRSRFHRIDAVGLVLVLVFALVPLAVRLLLG